MFGRTVVPAILSAALIPGVGLAQSQTPSAGQADPKPSAQTSQNAQSLPQQIQQKLKSQGFTDVKVVPGSFLVSAKDKEGDPVMMVIGPHSMTVFTMHSSDRSTTGSGQNGSNPSKTNPSSK